MIASIYTQLNKLSIILLILVVKLITGQQSSNVTQQSTAPLQSDTTTARPNYTETGRQITGILDRFMSLGYDKRVRPNYGGPPVEVNVTMRILSISSVSEVMMDFTADFYFRQTWHDPRLSFKKLGDIQRLYVGAEVSKKIWLPDTFFGNEKLAYFHEATTPNVFLRIEHSGEVYRSIRLTVTSSCPMNLQYFPMDRQRCTIEAESYGYNIKDIIYKWAREDTAVERDKEISLPQFDIVKTVQKYRLEELSSGTYSRLIAEIHFARRMGYYLIQIYIPSSLIVVISWVSFWLHRNASPARVQLGVTTVLTMTTLMSSTNAALPKISYVKSIDIFLGTCFVMVFAALLEYATVGYLGKRIAMRKAQVQHAQSQAQARVFAQLQAQGAQGDCIAPTAAAVNQVPTSGVGGGSAAIFGSEPITSVSTAAAAASAMQAAQSSPILTANVLADPGSYQLDQAQQAALIQQLLAAFGHQTGEFAVGQEADSTAPPPPPPRPPERHRCRCSHHHNHEHNHNRAISYGLNQSSMAKLSTSKLMSADCCRSTAHLDAQGGSSGCNYSHHYSQRNLPRSCQIDGQAHDGCGGGGCKCAGSASSHTLPRNIGLQSSNHHPHSHPHPHNNHQHQRQPIDDADDDPLKGAQRSIIAGGCNKCSGHINIAPGQPNPNPTTQQPPSYCSPKSKGASAAATAAAATFVNMHRRNKGLPPSKNPNFAQFAWMGNPNRSLETIFGIRPSDIDKYSRVIFPVCFVCFQLMYWIVYLHISAFLESELQPPPT